MSTIKDGGPAFPWGEHGTHLGGMTLRDYFAAKAMHGQLVSQTAVAFYDDSQDDAEGLADWCYQMADAMLAAREAKP